MKPTWSNNTLVCPDGSLFTVRDDGTLELRGPGWERRRRRTDRPNTDLARICHMDNREQAIRIAELLAKGES